MDIGDIVFYGLIAISAVASIVKSTKKKAEVEEGAELPDFKGSNPGKWIKTILDEVAEADDDFIPSNPKKEVIQNPHKVETTYSTEAKSSENFRRKNESLERPNLNLERELYSKNVSKSKLKSVNNSDTSPVYSESVSEISALNPKEDFTESIEVKKAFIYGEILQTKF